MAVSESTTNLHWVLTSVRLCKKEKINGFKWLITNTYTTVRNIKGN